MVCFCCLMVLTAVFCAREAVTSRIYTMFVNDDQVGFNSVLWVDRNLPVHVACRMTVANDNVVMKKIVGSRVYTLANTVTVYHDRYVFLNYTLSQHDKWSLVTTYRCVDRSRPYSPNYSQVTISFTTQLPSTPASTLPPRYTHPPTISTPRWHPAISMTIAYSTEETRTVSPQIQGLNPLIYTVSVLILLGSLGLVGLLTCWIRVRRSYNRRHYQFTTNPQEYLDYVTDNNLTPLGTSELAASLEERPPTYRESEQMRSPGMRERQKFNGEGIIPVLRGSLTRILSSSDSRRSSSCDGESISIRDAHTARDCESASDGLIAIRISQPRQPSDSTVATRHLTPISASISTDHDERNVTSVLLQPTRTTSSLITLPPNLSSTISQQVIESSIESKSDVPDDDIIIANLRGCPQTSSSVQNTDFEHSSSVTDDQAPTSVSDSSSGVDALLSMELNTRNGNGTQLATLEPHLQVPESEAPVGLLIDLT